MILSDREIRAAILKGALKITPDPPAEAWTSTAVDLKLDKNIVIWKEPSGGGIDSVVCPADREFDFDFVKRNFSDPHEIPAGGFRFKPRSFILGWTVERIQLPHPSRLAARVEGKSSLARLGIGVHITAPTIHAGFGYKPGDSAYLGSPLQLEIWNAGPLDIRLEFGMPICQLIFELVDGTPEKGYAGKFSVQGPTSK